MRKPYFARYRCAFCSRVASRYICSSTDKRQYFICDNKDCEKKTLIKLHFYTIRIKGLDKCLK